MGEMNDIYEVIESWAKGDGYGYLYEDQFLFFNYIKMDYKKYNEERTGFKFETNVWELFTEAEAREDVDIEELYRKLFREWRNDVKLVAELSMCMNWKLWEHHEK